MMTGLEQKLSLERATMITILVATLGYFVDVFDLLLFSIVRVQSLKDLGVAEADLLSTGILLINTQMAGLLIGGILWGVWGDRMGRVSVLFGSILLYSIANIANGFVQNVEQYAGLRFIAGLGLAGELGAGITLASELLPKQWRGLGTTFIASLGVGGAVFAAIISQIVDWRVAYVIGGVMGLALLMLRMQVRESALFEVLGKKPEKFRRGNPLMLLKPRLFKKYIATICIGLPEWSILGLFITFTPEFAKAFGMVETPKAGNAVMFFYIGLVLGDMVVGLLSQLLRSRRKALGIFLGLIAASTVFYIYGPHHSLEGYYGLCLFLGVGCGYWAMFVQVAAEQFGTNLRATATTSIPNMVRGSTILATASFHALMPHWGVADAGFAVVAATILLAVIGLASIRETFDTDLDYVEN